MVRTSGHLRGAISPGSGYDLKALVGERPHEQGERTPWLRMLSAFCVLGRFVAEGAKSSMAASGPGSQGHITMNETQTQFGHCWEGNLRGRSISG